MKVSIGDVTLFDDRDGSGDALSGFDGVISRLVDEVPLVDADEPFIAARQNKRAPINFSVSRANGRVEDAFVAMFGDEADIPDDTPLRIVQGGTAITIPGTHESVRVRHIGSRTFHDYTFRGGKPVVAPAPPTMDSTEVTMDSDTVTLDSEPS